MGSTVMIGRRDTAGDELSEKIRAADAEAAEWFFDDGWRQERFADIVSVMFEGFDHENLVELMVEVENAGEFEPITFEEVRGLEVFWVSNGAQVDSSTLTDFVWELPRDYVGFHVYEFVKKIRSGFARHQARLVSAAIAQMDAAVSARVFRTFQAAIPSTSPFYIGTPGVSLAAIRTALTEVRDESLSDDIAIIGRGTMIDQIGYQLQDDNLFTQETNQELMDRGVLGVYNGARLIKLKNFKDRNDAPILPANEAFVLGADAGKVGFWAGVTATEWIEQGKYWHNEGTREAGFAVHHPERARRVVDTSMT